MNIRFCHRFNCHIILLSSKHTQKQDTPGLGRIKEYLNVWFISSQKWLLGKSLVVRTLTDLRIWIETWEPYYKLNCALLQFTNISRVSWAYASSLTYLSPHLEWSTQTTKLYNNRWTMGIKHAEVGSLLKSPILGSNVCLQWCFYNGMITYSGCQETNYFL